MKRGQPPYRVVITDRRGVTITFTTEDLDLEADFEDAPPVERWRGAVIIRPPAIFKRYVITCTTPSIVMDATNATLPECRRE